MDGLASALRVGVAVALLLIASVELLRFLTALTAVVGAYVEIAHGAFALLAALAGIGLWLRTRWAPVALGCVFAATRTSDALVLGIRPWLLALLAALAALVAAVVLAAWARGETRSLT